MAASFVTETTGGANGLTVTVTPANTAGNLLVLCIGCRPGGVTFTVADTGGNTWTQATIQGSTAIWYSLTTAIAGTVTVTGTGATAANLLSCLEFSGVGAGPLDVAFSGASATNNAPSTGTSAATTQADEVVVAFIQQNSSSAVFSAQTAGYTARPLRQFLGTSYGLRAQSAYKVLAATGTQAYGASSTAATTWTAILATFKASGSTPIAITAAIASTSAVAADVTQSIALSADLTSTSALAASSTQAIALSATVASTSTVAAATTQAIALSAAIASSSAVNATVSLGTQIAISAAIASTSSLSAAITKGVALSAVIASTSALSASPKVALGLSCTISSTSGVSGMTQVRVALSASIVSTSALTGQVTVTLTVLYLVQHEGTCRPLSRGGGVLSDALSGASLGEPRLGNVTFNRHGAVTSTQRQGAAK